MNLYFDLDAGYFVTSPGSRERLTTMELKRGDTCSLAVRFLTGGTVTGLATGATGKFGMKEQGDFDGDFVASAGTWTKTGTGLATVYTFSVNLSTTELNELLGVGAAADVASVTLNAEMEFIADGVRTSSNTIRCTVYNDVIRGTESGPAEVSDGTPVNYAVTVEGELTSESSTPVTVPKIPFIGFDAQGNPMFRTDDESFDFMPLYNLSTLVGWQLSGTGDVGAWSLTTSEEDPNGLVLLPDGSNTGSAVIVVPQATPGVVGSMKVAAGYLYAVTHLIDEVPIWQRKDMSYF